MRAFSLHASYAKRIICPFCGSAVQAQIKPKARKAIPPRFRKVAVIGFTDPKKAPSDVLKPLNEALEAGRRLSLIGHLEGLKEAGVIKEVEYTTRPELL